MMRGSRPTKMLRHRVTSRPLRYGMMLMPWRHTPALLSAWIRLASFVNKYLRTICMHEINERSGYASSGKCTAVGHMCTATGAARAQSVVTPMLLWRRPEYA